jgi:hypothetical protein
MLDDLYKVKYKGGISLSLVVETSHIFIKDLMCKLCGDLAWDINLCLYCDTVYCNVCISRWLKRKRHCLECKSEYVGQKLQKTMNDIVNEKVMLKCLYYNNGCSKAVKYSDFFSHLNKCKFTKTLSPAKSLRSSYSKEKNFLTKNSQLDKTNLSKSISNKDSLYISSIKSDTSKLLNCSVCKGSYNVEEFNSHNNFSCVRKLNNTNYEELRSRIVFI